VIAPKLGGIFWHFSKHNFEAASVGGLLSSPCHRQSCALCVAMAHSTTSSSLLLRSTRRFIRERPDLSEHTKAHLRGDT
jgi:hypothetical protein